MPSARSATSAARAAGAQRPRTRPTRPRRVDPFPTLSRVRWDRKFRTVMLIVLALVGYIGAEGVSSLLASRAQAQQEQAIVHTLARQNRRLEQQARALTQPATIVSDARALGMVRAGERAYAITGLPPN
jgi:cell division protein FtsB